MGEVGGGVGDVGGAGVGDVGGVGVVEVGVRVGEDPEMPPPQAMSQQLTFTFYNDPVVGTPLRHFRGGPGAEQMITDEGFTPAA